jgi:hypothetical protein
MNHPETKQCTKCGEEKELGKMSKKGSWCKACDSEDSKKRQKKYKKANKERIKNGTQEERIKSFNPDGTKPCSTCGAVRDLSDFGVRNRVLSGSRNECKGCKAFEDATRRGKETPRKAMELTREEYLDIYYGDKCSYCDEPNPHGVDRIDSSKPYTKDNTQELCFLCNQAKNSLTESELFLHIEKMHEHIKKIKKCELT